MSDPKNQIDAPPDELLEPDEAQEFFSGEAEESSGVDLDLDAEPAASSFKRGLKAIRAHWKHAPMGPGVYRMIAEDGAVLYVGKAKSIKKRVASYTRLAGHANRIARMIALTASMVFVSTRTEVEALLLEANLIKQLKPRFNVLMRDDKSFPYILLTRDERGAQLTKHRGARSRERRLFRALRQCRGGQPHPQRAATRLPVALLREFFLRQSQPALPSLPDQALRRPLRRRNFAGKLRRAGARGPRLSLRQNPRGARAAGGRNERFRRKARIRAGGAAARPHFRPGRDPGPAGDQSAARQEADVFALHEEAGQFCVEAVFYRAFQNWGNRAYFPRADKSLSAGEVLGPFVAQFYAERPPPDSILLSHEIDERGAAPEALA